MQLSSGLSFYLPFPHRIITRGWAFSTLFCGWSEVPGEALKKVLREDTLLMFWHLWSWGLLPAGPASSSLARIPVPMVGEVRFYGWSSFFWFVEHFSALTLFCQIAESAPSYCFKHSKTKPCNKGVLLTFIFF